MKGRTFLSIAIVVISLLILTGFGIAFYISKKGNTPLSEMEAARGLIFEAWNSGAEQYSLDILRTSETYYDSAMNSWQNENKKFFITRDYSKIRVYARLSSELALKARNRSVAQNSGHKLKLAEKLENLQNEIEDFDSIYSRFPLPQTVTDEYNRGRQLYSEAVQYFSAGQNSLCENKIMDSGIALYSSYRKALAFLKDYFANYYEWQQWAWNTIDSSIRNQSTVIIVDKLARDLFVYHNGILMNTFKVELGPNWIGDKRQEGDRATPEGFYRVKEKLEGRRTRFYKALLLNYPNEEDIRDFNQAKRNGTLHRSARIGGAIEIHGSGGMGRDWTNGCVALTNSEMDIVYGYTTQGTLITIVGSLKSLKEIMQN